MSAVSKIRAIGTNQLLAALPLAELECVEPWLEFESLALGDVLYQSGSLSPYVHFASTSIMSLLHILVNGAYTEIALIETEGVADISLNRRSETMAGSAVVPSVGGAYRLPSRIFRQEHARGGILQQLLLPCSQALIARMGQTAACNRHHALEQQ